MLGSLLIPGLGPVLAGGVLASTLAGVGIGAATGGLLGALMGLGVPEEDAKHFDRGFREGGTLVTVDAGARTPEALAILSRHEVDLGPSGYTRYGERRIGLRSRRMPARDAGRSASDRSRFPAFLPHGAQVKAIRVHRTGGPEVLRLEDVPIPEPGPGRSRWSGSRRPG